MYCIIPNLIHQLQLLCRIQTNAWALEGDFVSHDWLHQNMVFSFGYFIIFFALGVKEKETMEFMQFRLRDSALAASAEVRAVSGVESLRGSPGVEQSVADANS